MHYILVATLKASTGQADQRQELFGTRLGKLVDATSVYLIRPFPVSIADPTAFGLYPSVPVEEYPVAHPQTPAMLAFAAKINQLLAESKHFQPAPSAPPRCLARHLGPAT